ncbi:DNA/RNA non-specific endonuclease [bacterium]|nr:DNA/RNA non-specific endonuclease [bacterium]
MKKLYALLLSLTIGLTGCKWPVNTPVASDSTITSSQTTVTVDDSNFDIDDIPLYNGSPYIVINNNVPFDDLDTTSAVSFETYSDLDKLGRCGVATACLSVDTMPAEGEERGSIGMVKPAGWHTVKYPDIISDLYLYNRCHLIGWQLGAENANEKNLTTGTRYLNVEGMLPFENQIADYIKTTNNHVMYRVTPVFVGNELICRGIILEACSVEDTDCIFNVYCYNVQPGIGIDYATGESWINSDTNASTDSDVTDNTTSTYVLNTKSMKIHMPDCQFAKQISEYNRSEYTGDIDTLFEKGYSGCGSCDPY